MVSGRHVGSRGATDGRQLVHQDAFIDADVLEVGFLQLLDDLVSGKEGIDDGEAFTDTALKGILGNGCDPLRHLRIALKDALLDLAYTAICTTCHNSDPCFTAQGFVGHAFEDSYLFLDWCSYCHV